MTSGLLPYISWLICTVQSHSILYLSFSITTSSFCLYHFSFTYIHIFYIFPNGSAIQTNHVVFYTPSGLTCCICLTHDLHSSQLSHTFYIYCFFFFVLSIFAFMLLILIACSCAAIIKTSVVLFMQPFNSHPHWFSLALPVVCLINCPYHCFCVHCAFLAFFFLFLYSFHVPLFSVSSVVHAAINPKLMSPVSWTPINPLLPSLLDNIITIIIELTHSKTILVNTIEIKPQPVALGFKNLSQYSSCCQ